KGPDRFLNALDLVGYDGFGGHRPAVFFRLGAQARPARVLILTRRGAIGDRDDSDLDPIAHQGRFRWKTGCGSPRNSASDKRRTPWGLPACGESKSSKDNRGNPRTRSRAPAEQRWLPARSEPWSEQSPERARSSRGMGKRKVPDRTVPDKEM